MFTLKTTTSLLFLWLSLIFVYPVQSQISDIQEYDHGYLFYLSDPSISPSPILTGRSGAMGSLQFSTRDSTRDVFINPAKYYGNNGGILSPSLNIQNFQAEQNSGAGGIPLRQNSDNIAYSIPVGFMANLGSMYFAGAFGYTNYSLEEDITQQNSDNGFDVNTAIEREISGRQFVMISGYRLSDDIAVSASYQRNNLKRDEFTLNNINLISTDFSVSQIMDFGKLGASINILGGKSYLLGGVFKSQQEYDQMDSVGFYWQELSGILFQAEHLHPVSSTYSIGGFFGYEKRNFSDRTSTRLYDEYTNLTRSFQIGTGLNRITKKSELGLEVLFRPINYELNQNQPLQNPDGLTTLKQSIDSSHFIIRLGSDFNIWKTLRVQAGFSRTIASDRNLNQEIFTEVPSEDIFQRNFRNDSLNSPNRTLVTTGFGYSFQSLSIQYYLELFYNNLGSNTPRYRNQLNLQYRF